MTEEKYISFIKSNLEACYYDLADRMLLLPIIESLLCNWDKSLNGKDQNHKYKLIEYEKKIDDLTNHISSLIENNNILKQSLLLYTKKEKISSTEVIELYTIRNVIDRYFNRDTTQKIRKRETVYARQMGMYFAKELTNESLSVIGREFGNKDHATVLHSIRTINNLTMYPKTRKNINELKIIFNSIINKKEINAVEFDMIWAY